MNERQGSILLAYAFRPFFLLTGIYGVTLVLAWIGFLFAGWPLPLGWSPLHWHSHEMIYGLVPAAAAGFALTAVTNWTNALPLRGGALLALVLLWLAGRVAFWSMAWTPLWLIAVVDLAFLPVLAVYLGVILVRYEKFHNLLLVGILATLAVGNLLMHLGLMAGSTALIKAGQELGLNVTLLMMVAIAGRITPLFTINWLKNNGGNPERVTRSEHVDRYAIFSVAILVVVDILPVPAYILGAVALIAGVINGVRLFQWGGWHAAREPLLWILHLAYLWIVVALLLRGAGAFTLLVPDTLWQHALGVGAIASLILGVMTRVALGHTGRPLKLPRFAVIIYVAILSSALLRVLAAAHVLDYRLGVTLAGLGWIIAFLAFVIIYWPILSSPRADGRTG